MPSRTIVTTPEYCKSCGTMMLLGVCKRCTPDVRIESAQNAKIRAATSSQRNKHDTHLAAVDVAMKYCEDNDIGAYRSTKRGVDITLDDGRGVLIRSTSKTDANVPLMNGSLDTLKADVLMIINNMAGYIQKVYIIDMAEAIRIAVNLPYRVDGRNNYFIPRTAYEKYADNLAAVDIK